MKQPSKFMTVVWIVLLALMLCGSGLVGYLLSQ